MTVVLEIQSGPYSDAPTRVVGPVPWPWQLPRREDVIAFGAPEQRCEVQWVRFDLAAGQVVIVCEQLR